MKRWIILCVHFAILLYGYFWAPAITVAQMSPGIEESDEQVRSSQIPEVERIIAPEQKATIETLRKIFFSQRELRQQIDQKLEELQAAGSEESQASIRKRLQELYVRLEDMENDFESIATGVDLLSFTTDPAEGFDWQKEFQDLLRPILEELKGLTAHPREIERLRNEVAYYQKRLLLIEKAIARIEESIAAATLTPLRQELAQLQKMWNDRQQEFSSQLATAQRQLDDKLAAEQSIVKTVQSAFRNFFKSRGLNLFLSLLAFVAILLLMRMLQRIIYKAVYADRSGKRPFYLRLAGILYYIFSLLAATTALLLILYMSGDWVLLGLALIFLFGVAWTGKQALPRFWEQVKLLLNLSTVREGERVIYQGLPWKIFSLNIYTILHNPELKGGMVRLPLGELLGIHSRPFYKDEPWFPCREGDFVLLSDGSYGQILMQTPETVQIQTLISHKTYLTPDFLQLSPLNLSRNFTIHVTFGVDYQHQSIVTQQIPAILKTIVTETLHEQGYGEELFSLKVEFKEAGASSLDLTIIAEFSGQAAKNYYVLSRAIQRIAVDACNQHDWVIPFTQLTIHSADTLQKHGHTE